MTKEVEENDVDPNLVFESYGASENQVQVPALQLSDLLGDVESVKVPAATTEGPPLLKYMGEETGARNRSHQTPVEPESEKPRA